MKFVPVAALLAAVLAPAASAVSPTPEWMSNPACVLFDSELGARIFGLPFDNYSPEPSYQPSDGALSTAECYVSYVGSARPSIVYVVYSTFADDKGAMGGFLTTMADFASIDGAAVSNATPQAGDMAKVVQYGADIKAVIILKGKAVVTLNLQDVPVEGITRDKLTAMAGVVAAKVGT